MKMFLNGFVIEVGQMGAIPIVGLERNLNPR